MLSRGTVWAGVAGQRCPEQSWTQAELLHLTLRDSGELSSVFCLQCRLYLPRKSVADRFAKEFDYDRCYHMFSLQTK